MMRTVLYFAGGLLLFAALLVRLHGGTRTAHSDASGSRPDLEYWKAINKVGPAQDPQSLFLLMAQYSNANLQGEGAEFFSARLKEFGTRLTDAQRALYLSAIGLLRAQHAASVPWWNRFGYVKETIATLEQAKQLSGGKVFVVNWIAGIVHSELPALFGQRKAAEAELAWCVANADRAPHAGWLREVYYHQGKLARAEGDAARAREYLRRSGYTDFDRPITLITPFSEDSVSGHTFSPRAITEIVPGRVYALSGFEFTEYYFVVSDDGRELFGIDAGARPDSARSAYEAVRAYAPGLPELTAIFITHSHWDHVGGHPYFDGLHPRPRYYARSNYRDEIANDLQQPSLFDKQFFGTNFSLDNVRSFQPDVLIDRRTEMKIGGTRIELVPVQGGETRDGMFIHFPDLGTMFVGDFMMPYFGAPFVEEGDVQGLLDGIDLVVERQPQHLLHGHEPLTRNFASAAVLAHLKTDLAWLREQVLQAIQRGEERGAIYRANLVPPGFLEGPADVYQAYFLMREHLIDRLYDQNVGYWQADLQGLEHLTRADHAELLVDYLGVSEEQMVRSVRQLAADGKYELAAWLLESSGNRFEHSSEVANVKRLVYLKLMEKNQNTDPFKFILYSGKIGEQTPQMK